ncbi:HAD hydrolase, TIGR02254 family [Pseudoflavonifractor capillosus ATCC 29799]|uniref:HAD hydrolase, TIGR02254 family n=1 Tax=Pseudoflavonifractor capillosus ATCC 29799 TaxID=411467 RepID=A6NRB3_9FIRM|nr:YjjG family noncanonical pyrimidine nucleotidase [Pseudoflavonifractor capillosus]EDN01609.1 HAD hydrolase, TIGR02254 family [Pseudoflavonifractor capillosus ATCC 29799]
MEQRYDVVLFDADNTLFDFDAAEAQALDLTLAEYGYPVDDKSRNCYLAVNRDLWARFDRGEVKREWLVVERFAALQRALGGHHDPAEMNTFYLARLAEAGCLLPGAEALCRALVPTCTLAIVTNGVASAQRGRFDRSPLKELIPWLFISEEVGYQKPQRQFFDAVLSAMSLPQSARIVVVGDSLTADILGAVNAGLDSIWYNPNGLPGRPDIVPTFEARSFDQVLHLIVGGV